MPLLSHPEQATAHGPQGLRLLLALFLILPLFTWAQSPSAQQAWLLGWTADTEKQLRSYAAEHPQDLQDLRVDASQQRIRMTAPDTLDARDLERWFEPFGLAVLELRIDDGLPFFPGAGDEADGAKAAWLEVNREAYERYRLEIQRIPTSE
ncbi:MAG TPA: hypothetical protein VGE21_11965 [Flavobacteriales bacterium]